MKLTGAEILIECLKREGVKTIFALPGGVVLKIFDVLHQQKDIDVVLTRHEQGAGHMAEGYAKATGKAGVCLVTSGPGMTNVITALADATWTPCRWSVLADKFLPALLGTTHSKRQTMSA